MELLCWTQTGQDRDIFSDIFLDSGPSEPLLSNSPFNSRMAREERSLGPLNYRSSWGTKSLLGGQPDGTGWLEVACFTLSSISQMTTPIKQEQWRMRGGSFGAGSGS